MTATRAGATESKAESKETKETHTENPLITDNVDIPDEYICPINKVIMDDPVIAADGHTYEREAIFAWFNKGSRISPLTGLKLAHTVLTPNHALKKSIATCKEKMSYLQKQELEKKDLQLAIKLREEAIVDLLTKKREQKESLTNSSENVSSEFLKKEQERSLELQKQNTLLQQNLNEEKEKNIQLQLQLQRSHLLLEQFQGSLNQFFGIRGISSERKLESFNEGRGDFKRSGTQALIPSASEVKNLSIEGLITKELFDYKVWAIRMRSLPNGHMACGFGDGLIKIFDPTTNSCVQNFKGHGGRLGDFAVFRNKFLVSVSDDGKVKLWNMEDNYSLHKELSLQEGLTSISIISDELFAIGTRGKLIKIINFNTGKVTRILKSHQEAVYGLAKLPGTNKLASCSGDSDVFIWNLESGQVERRFSDHTKLIFEMRLLSNGLLFTGCDDNTARIWDLEKNECISVLDGHTHFVNGVAELPNWTIATSSEDNSIKIWNILSGKCLETIRAHNFPVWGIASYVRDNQAWIMSGDTKGHIVSTHFRMSPALKSTQSVGAALTSVGTFAAGERKATQEAPKSAASSSASPAKPSNT